MNVRRKGEGVRVSCSEGHRRDQVPWGSSRGNKSPDIVAEYNYQLAELADRLTVNHICEQRERNLKNKQKVNGEKGKWKPCGLCGALQR